MAKTMEDAIDEAIDKIDSIYESEETSARSPMADVAEVVRSVWKASEEHLACEYVKIEARRLGVTLEELLHPSKAGRYAKQSPVFMSALEMFSGCAEEEEMENAHN